jgi:hypothetical protein
MVYFCIALVPLGIAFGLQYLIFPLYGEVGSGKLGSLTLLISIFLVTFALLMMSFVFGLSVFQARPYQEVISLKDIQDIGVSTYQGLTREYASLLFVTREKTLNIVAVKTLPEDVIQVVRQYTE